MSEPIIIETPTTTRERLVLVPPDAVSRTEGGDELLTIRTANARDATPADLLRAGYVPREVPSAEAWKAAHAEAERELIRARSALAEQPDPGTLAHLRADLRDAVKRAEKAERERDEALGRAQSETEWRVRAVSERQDAEVERDTLRAELARLTAPGEGSEGEPTDEELGQAYIEAWNKAASDDEASNPVARRALFRAGVAHERARQQPAKDLREVSAELEAMRTTHDERERVYVGAIASDEELVTVYRRAAEPLGDEHGVSLRDLVQRYQAHGVLAVAARVRQERCLVAQAVDEELFGAYQRAFVLAADEEDDIEEEPDPERLKVDRVTPEERAGILAVAARVRQERCLVAQAVARGWYIYLCPQKNDPSKWDIETGRVIAGRSDGGAILHGVPASDVPATLARLLGEVEK